MNNGIHAVGFFPGLGSRAAYRELGSSLLDSGNPEISAIYRDGAAAIGFPGEPGRILLAAENLPAVRSEQQGFVGAAFLVHGLALEALLRAEAARRGVRLEFAAYTGESFGVLAAAVAAGSLSVLDGVRIARAFTPLMLLAAEGAAPDGPYARELVDCLSPEVRERPLVREAAHVVALRGEPDELAAALDGLARHFPAEAVEVHKLYSPRQTNVYVAAGSRSEFADLLTAFPGVRAEELKSPTTFLAHSARLREARNAFEKYIDRQGVEFRTPHTPVISNNGTGMLATAAGIRDGVLAMADEIMASRTTVEILDGLRIDMTLELGMGNKSVQLLTDNNAVAPALAYAGAPEETELLLGAVSAAEELEATLERLADAAGAPAAPELATLRDVLRRAARSPFAEQYLGRTLARTDRPEPPAGSTARRLLETARLSHRHRALLDAESGELVLRARLRKRIEGAPEELGLAYTELRVLRADGRTETRTAPGGPEVLVVHLGGGREAAGEVGRRYALHGLLAESRPVLFEQSDHYLAGSDRAGWLAALAVAGALPVERAEALLATARYGSREELAEELAEVTIGAVTVPVISPDGIPLETAKDLTAATRAVLLDGALARDARPVHLGGSCLVLALGAAPLRVDAGPFPVELVPVPGAEGIRQRGAYRELDEAEDRAALARTEEDAKLLRYARGRRLLAGTVRAYLHADEEVVGFGQGGSESMTFFLRREGESRITVRKILSEALTTARWDQDGEGVMLPPFAKARKQAEYLQALPESVKANFPEVFDVLERVLPVPAHLAGDVREGHQEVIYEMSYVEGEEVSRFVEKHSPPPAVLARLYEQLFRVLNEQVHAVGRVPAPGETLDVSYFRKIEDRLALSRRTAPLTFSPELLDTERITINGVSYLNSGALLRQFREHPEYLEVLEPRFHSLVMGDTNTENVKLATPEPLLRAQELIEAGAPQSEIEEALAAITAESLGIKFLDPRSIGFKTDGAETRDDPMYDNKPWHNSVGHYDEIHFERFKLTVETGPGHHPSVEVEFEEGNPYQRAYRVRDVTAAGEQVRGAGERLGMEDWFAPVMTAAYDLDDPDSAYLREDPYWLIRFVFLMGTHFTAMPPFHFQAELDGTLTDGYQTQRRPVAIYCEGVKWLNWALEMLEGRRKDFLGLAVPPLPWFARRFSVIQGTGGRQLPPGTDRLAA
ncbi:ACP S-malonyltransferase [Kitasatospora sp. NPDC096147]|uniref:ACP S-malonyltransferase n=1 Tax=Kitasatospora sp. NPDC096147 TaxID=3364093 RepID=UPI0037FFC98B